MSEKLEGTLLCHLLFCTAAKAYLKSEDIELRHEALDFGHQLWIYNTFKTNLLTPEGKEFLDVVPYADEEFESVVTH